MPLTLEERERIAYITNSPDHPLLAELSEGYEDYHDDLRHERDEFKEDAEQLGREKSELETELEAAEERNVTLSGRVEDLEIEVSDLEEKIYAAGVDLV